LFSPRPHFFSDAPRERAADNAKRSAPEAQSTATPRRTATTAETHDETSGENADGNEREPQKPTKADIKNTAENENAKGNRTTPPRRQKQRGTGEPPRAKPEARSPKRAKENTRRGVAERSTRVFCGLFSFANVGKMAQGLAAGGLTETQN
jgi:hypothetical protein